VLSQLLYGSGYNVLIIGDQGQGTPRRIVLSVRPAGPAQPSGNLSPGASNEEETEAEQPQPEPQPAPPREAPPSVPVRTPQQVLQDMQQRQQQQGQQQQN
jgi:hypothetical protein